MANRQDETKEKQARKRSTGRYLGDGSLGHLKGHPSPDERPESGNQHDLEETLDRERHGSGEYDPEESYGRRDVKPDREHAGPGDEDEPDTAEGEPKRGRLPRKQDPE